MTEMDFRSAANGLADFHGQHEQQFIMNADTHIDFLDRFCKSEDLVEMIQSIYSNLIDTIQSFDHAIIQKENASNHKELLQFQIKEIDTISPQLDEDIQLGREFKRLNHIDELISTVQNMNQSLIEHDHSIYRQLASTLNELERLSKYDESLQPFMESINQASVSIQDASAGLLQYADMIDNDPNRLQEVEERLHAIENLKRKYGGTIESVLSFIQDATKELEVLSGLDEKIADLEIEKSILVRKYKKAADQLHHVRTKLSKAISKQIETEMNELNMVGSTFQVLIDNKIDNKSLIEIDGDGVAIGPKGYDQVEFFLSANPGEMPKPLTKVASGGEVSRIMLAIKSVLKKSDPVSTLIFDEIDSGISGEAAERVGSALKALAIEKQVICITHLPQIASCAEHHLYINKKIENEQTDVIARYLNEKEKVEAIAQLFSGESISVEGISSAKQLRNQARG
tara:strand:- start:141 stop:1511 length:1371 start_codon:yes stop_codon:yes gene_type:complete